MTPNDDGAWTIELARRVWDAAMVAGDPTAAVERAWPASVERAESVVLMAAGKASAAMARAAAAKLGDRLGGRLGDQLGDRLRAGVVIAPDASVSQAHVPECVRVFAADHPLPTERNLAAADAVVRTAAEIGSNDVVLVLVSGGASAFLTKPALGISLDELRGVTDGLLRAGATITELNTVRKHLDVLKGGGLARLCAHAGSVEVLVLSDVLGDPLDVIGSGPTAPDPTTFVDAQNVLEQHSLTGRWPGVDARLRRGAAGDESETPKPGDVVFDRVQHVVIANNAAAVDTVVRALGDAGMRVVDRRTGVTGEAAEVGRSLASAAARLGRREAIVWGGETTVTVGEATGSGGRNQELALAAGLALPKSAEFAVLSLATDGLDGPTDAAGAIAVGGLGVRAEAAPLSPEHALRDHDSGTFWAKLDGGAWRWAPGPSGTNINDLMIALRYGG